MAVRRSKLLNLISTQRLGSSVSTKTSIVGQVKELFPIWKSNRDEMQMIDTWYRAELDENMLPSMPNDATDEFKSIREKSPTPWGRLIVGTMSQVMSVDDFRLPTDGKSSPAYSIWQRNGMDGRQVPLHNGMLAHGQSYNLVLPAIGRLDGAKTALIRGKSAIRALGFYRDDFDEYPEFFLEGEPQRDIDNTFHWRLDFYDDVSHHRLVCDRDGSNMEYIDYEPHGMKLCPVVRFANTIDLDGRVVGEIKPFINLFGRIDQDTQDRLVVQRYSAWAVRTIAGMKEPATDADKAAARIALGIGDFMVSEDKDTKFGTLPGTPMDGFIRSREADIRDLAAVSQTPSHHLLGLADNVGAEGLAAAEAAMQRKRNERRKTTGESHEATMRLAGYAAGDPGIANDFESKCHWEDTDTKSFQSLAQALGILATQLGIPPEMLWTRLPDWTQVDTTLAKKLVKQAQADAAIEAELAAAAKKTTQAGATGGTSGAAA